MSPSAVSVGELQHVSATQITGFKLCNRRWWFEKVAKVPALPSPAAELGGHIHGQIEAWYESQTVPTHASAALLVASGLIPEPGPDSLIEHPRDFVLGIYSANVAIRGRIDLFNKAKLESEGLIEIWDWKSKADFRYAKTPDELGRDVQMMIYGKYAFAWHKPQEVVFVHGNIKTGKGTGYKIVRSEPVAFDVVEEYGRHVVEPIVREMKVCATAPSFEEAPPNFNSCYAFNKPCPFLEKCTVGQSASVSIAMLFKNEGEGMGLGEKLKNKLVSDDVNTTTIPVQGQASFTAGSDLAHYTSTAPKGFTLYINALPVKGVDNVVHLDDIIADASRDICGAKKVLDLRLIPYGEGKALLAAGLRKNPPSGVIVATTGELSDVAIEALLPLATVVIRGTR